MYVIHYLNIKLETNKKQHNTTEREINKKNTTNECEETPKNV